MECRPKQRGQSDMHLSGRGSSWSPDITQRCSFLPYSALFQLNYLSSQFQKNKSNNEVWSLQVFAIALAIQMSSKMNEH